MRTLKTALVLMLLAIFVGPVKADDDSDEPKGDRPERGEFRQKMLEEFDADGDGELSDEERATARETMRSRRGKEGSKGRRGGGKRGAGPPNPEELFERFDADGDGQLSREEFHKLAESMREHHEKMRRGKGPRGEGQGRRQGPPNGPRYRPGPREEDRRKFRPAGPLQNPGDRSGKPPRAGKGRHGGRPGGPGGRGPAGRDFEQRRPPNPDEVFDQFDTNDDGQLSREEFGELSQAMRKHHGREKGKMGKGRGGRSGDRRGPAGRGRPDGPRQRDLGENAGEASPADEADSF